MEEKYKNYSNIKKIILSLSKKFAIVCLINCICFPKAGTAGTAHSTAPECAGACPGKKLEKLMQAGTGRRPIPLVVIWKKG